jgi:hypothetical protein
MTCGGVSVKTGFHRKSDSDIRREIFRLHEREQAIEQQISKLTEEKRWLCGVLHDFVQENERRLALSGNETVVT